MAGLADDDDRAWKFLPRALNVAEASLVKLGKMRLDAFDKAVAIQKTAAGFEEAVDRAVAGEDLLEVAQVVERDCGDGEIEGTADLLRP